MSPKYDIFKKTDNSVVWIEAVEDIVAANKRQPFHNPGKGRFADNTRGMCCPRTVLPRVAYFSGLPENR